MLFILYLCTLAFIFSFVPEILDSIRTNCDALVHIVCHVHSDFVIALTDTSSHFHLGQ
jgi:hypothetical protein